LLREIDRHAAAIFGAATMWLAPANPLAVALHNSFKPSRHGVKKRNQEEEARFTTQR